LKQKRNVIKVERNKARECHISVVERAVAVSVADSTLHVSARRRSAESNLLRVRAPATADAHLYALAPNLYVSAFAHRIQGAAKTRMTKAL